MKQLVSLFLACALFPLFSAAAEAPKEPVTCLLGALGEEVDLLFRSLEQPQEQKLLGVHLAVGKLKGRRVVVCRSGVGKVNAAMVATLLIEHYKPSEVIFTGIAGGINPELKVGDIVIATKTAQHDLGTLHEKGMELRGTRSPITWQRNPVFFESDSRLLTLADQSAKTAKLEKIESYDGDRQPRIVKGIVVTGDIFVASTAKRDELRKTLQADAVEMEGAAVAQICRQLNTPCLVIRSICDTADGNARQDSDVFSAVAGKNSAQLVLGLVERLATAPPASTQK